MRGRLGVGDKDGLGEKQLLSDAKQLAL